MIDNVLYSNGICIHIQRNLLIGKARKLGSYIRAFGCGRLLQKPKPLSFHPQAVLKRIRLDGANITPYDTPERRVVGKKIVNIEYHQIDWVKNFAANRKG